MDGCVALLAGFGCARVWESVVFYLAISGAVACAATPFLAVWATRSGIVDAPAGGRKKHRRATPLLGGLAVCLAVAAAAMLFTQTVFPGLPIPARSLFGLLMGAAVLCIGGYLDDRYSLPPHLQICFPVAAAALAVGSGIHIPYIRAPWSGTIVGLESMSVAVPWGTFFWPADPMTFFWLLGLMYATKFIDGVDGLVTGLMVIAGLVMVAVSLRPDVGQPATAALAAIVAGAFLGFLPWNWSPARMFLGESGSVFAGFAIGVLAVISGSKVATTLLLLGVPILDALAVILQRVFLDRTSPTRGDRRHLFARMIDAGLSERKTVLFFYALSLAFGLVGLAGTTRAKAVAFGLLMMLVTVLVLFLLRRTSRARV